MKWLYSQFAPLCVVALLAGCSPPLTSDELLSRAATAFASGDLASAEIDVKTILQKTPSDSAARSLYGQIYLKRIDPSAAVVEFERALETERNPETTVLLTKALLRAGESAEIVSEWENSNYLSVANSPEFQAVLARAYLIQEDYPRARESLANVEDAESPYIAMTRAVFADQLDKDPERARAILETLVESYPGEADAWSLLAGIARRAGERELAVEMLGKAAVANPYRFSDRIQRVGLQIDMGKADDAEEDLARLERQLPNYPPVHFLRGQVYFNAGEYKSALDMFSRVLAVVPDDSAALLLAAHANIREGNMETAQGQLSRLRVKYPSDLQSGLLLGSVLMNLGDVKRAEELSRGILEEHGMNIKALGILAASLAAQGLSAESAQYYAQISEQAPDSSGVLAALGSQEFLSGDLEAGISSLQAAVALAPDDVSARERLIDAQLTSGDLDAAYKSAESYVDVSENNARAQVYLGRVLVRQERLQEAADAFVKALDLSPGDPMASANLAALSLVSGDTSGALDALQAALKENPVDLATLMRLAMVQQQAGDYEGMEQSIRSALEAHPGAASPRVALARLELSRNAPGAATSLLAPIANDTQDNAAVLDVLVRAYLADEEPEPAENFLRRLLALRPDDKATLMLAGQVYNARGRYEVAESHLRQSLAKFPEDVGLRKTLIEALVYQRKLELAQVEVESLPEDVQDEVPVVVLRGRLALAAHDTERATALFSDAFDRVPASTTLVFLAGSKWASGKPDEAIFELENWLRDHPEDTMVLMSLGGYGLEQGNSTLARDSYAKVVKLQPNNVPALNNLAWLLKGTDPDAAIEFIQRADGLVPEMAQIKDTYAMIELERGDVERALSLNKMALELGRNSPEILFNRAQILLRSGQTEEARSLLEELVAGPAFGSQEAARKLLLSL